MGCLIDIGAHAAEDSSDLLLCLNMVEKCGGEGAIAAVAVVSRTSGLRRVSDDRTQRTVDPCKASSNVSTASDPNRAPQLVRERIVTTQESNTMIRKFFACCTSAMTSSSRTKRRKSASSLNCASTGTR